MNFQSLASPHVPVLVRIVFYEQVFETQNTQNQSRYESFQAQMGFQKYIEKTI
jgi:hypothetical protein